MNIDSELSRLISPLAPVGVNVDFADFSIIYPVLVHFSLMYLISYVHASSSVSCTSKLVFSTTFAAFKSFFMFRFGSFASLCTIALSLYVFLKFCCNECGHFIDYIIYKNRNGMPKAIIYSDILFQNIN